MAPSATTTVTETEKPVEATFFGAYKVLVTARYSKEKELGEGGAKVRTKLSRTIALQLTHH